MILRRLTETEERETTPGVSARSTRSPGSFDRARFLRATTVGHSLATLDTTHKHALSYILFAALGLGITETITAVDRD